MPVAYRCHQRKHWWLQLFLPPGRNANESLSAYAALWAATIPRSGYRDSPYYTPKKALQTDNVIKLAVIANWLGMTFFLNLMTLLQTEGFLYLEMRKPGHQLAAGLI